MQSTSQTYSLETYLGQLILWCTAVTGKLCAGFAEIT